MARKRGNRRCYCFRSCRVKIYPNATGKTGGSGRSKFVTRQAYPGTAEDVLRLIEETRRHQKPGKVSSRQFRLLTALFEVAERIGLRHIINRSVPGKVCGISAGDFVLIAAIHCVGNHHSKAGAGMV